MKCLYSLDLAGSLHHTIVNKISLPACPNLFTSNARNCIFPQVSQANISSWYCLAIQYFYTFVILQEIFVLVVISTWVTRKWINKLHVLPLAAICNIGKLLSVLWHFQYKLSQISQPGSPSTCLPSEYYIMFNSNSTLYWAIIVVLMSLVPVVAEKIILLILVSLCPGKRGSREEKFSTVANTHAKIWERIW